ncbi:bZIP transcription factor TGA10-like isoform X2 [Olea europaea var. sylvestris]|uniref:bZIP transcription factor TGA10-like isoform X2 n=1 Tax=Olea europaea var. sylvestris TaxID=158386 RepID=UPI000C1CF019|nr:bZIP transcription factor TGA10-like isoform X2 [Olea europaea var. sylvestris]
MDFASTALENIIPEEESQFLVGNPVMASDKGNNHSTQLVLDKNHQQQNHQMQQQINYDHQRQINQISFGMMQSSSSSSRSKDNPGAYDLGELDQALFLYLDGQDQSTTEEQTQNSGMRPPTLNIFPSQPMHVEPSSPTKASTGLLSPSTNVSKKSSGPSVEPSNPRNDVASAPQSTKARKGNRKGPTSSSEQDGPKTPDPKILRRLAQNREAARKSRLRKKAYVQQLESSRIRLTQLEQELQRARGQGFHLGGNSLLGGDHSIPAANISSDAAVFDMEYARWLEEHHRLMVALGSAMQDHVPENELRIYVDNCLAHYDQVMNLKSMIVKSDVFHLVSGTWKTPAERCFLWIGGFRPSELIKIISSQIEPLTEQQLLGIYSLQQSTQEAEEALSQGLEALNQSLSETITSDSLNISSDMNSFMGQMALAISKLSTFEGFVRQADNLRHQTLHRLHQILTTRQAARCFLAIAEYFHRLRALSSLWLARPRPE